MASQHSSHNESSDTNYNIVETQSSAETLNIHPSASQYEQGKPVMNLLFID
jgi:hypothetical protein